MTSMGAAATDSLTLLRRDLLRARRYPSITLSGLVLPVIWLLLFDGVFGHTMRAGLSGSLGAAGYVDYLLPGVLVMAAGGVAEATAISVNTDMGEGIIARLRTMPIWRPAVLVGIVSGAMIRTLVTGAAVLAVGIGLGAAPRAGAADWMAAIGLFCLLGLALTWLTVTFGMLAKTPAGANSLSLIPLFLPLLSSAFVPPQTMPAGVRAFADNQPFTPIIDTLRGLLAGGPTEGHLPAAVAWCVAVGVVGYVCSVALYNRGPARAE